MSTSDGSTADYYELPAGATELQDLISHRDMNSQIGEIFRACYRYGIVSHSGKLRDAKKIRFYAEAEVKRLESLLAQAKVDGCCATESQHPAGGFTYHFDPMTPPPSFGQQNMIDPAGVDIASAIDDDSERMQAIGQNGEMASEVYAAVDGHTGCANPHRLTTGHK